MSYDLLIVDDSITTRALIKRTIRQTGLPVGRLHEAADGAEALELLATTRVDLILADLGRSEIDSVETIGRLLSEPATRSIPVVILSAKPDPQHVDRLRRAGAKGCLRKPFTPAALRDALAEILEPTHA